MSRIAQEKAALQCVEQAARLWLRREHLIGEPHLSLSDLGDRDRQLQTHLDALASTGDAGWKVCEKELAWEEPGEVFPATYLALTLPGAADRLVRIADYALRSYELARPMVAAFAWKPLPEVMDPLEELLTADHPRLRRIGLAAALAHRQVPESALSDAIAQHDPALRARALRGVGEMGCLELLPHVVEQLLSDSPCCQLEAAWTCTLRAQLSAAIDRLLEVTRRPCAAAERAIRSVVRAMDVQDAVQHLQALAEQAALQRVAAIGSGALGSPDMVDWLIGQLDQPALARVAGEALTMITGLSLGQSIYENTTPHASCAPDLADPGPDPIESGPDEHLPWPNRAPLADWWQRHRGEFPSGRRYLLGRPIQEAWCREVLRHGLQRQRASAAVELAARFPAEPLVEVRAPAWCQSRFAE